MAKKIEEEIPELGDYNGTVEDLIFELKLLMDKHGGKALIKFDAGHNNVSVKLQSRK